MKAHVFPFRHLRDVRGDNATLAAQNARAERDRMWRAFLEATKAMTQASMAVNAAHARYWAAEQEYAATAVAAGVAHQGAESK